MRPGDTLSMIAVQNSTTVQALLALNPELEPNLLQVGQVVYLHDRQILHASPLVKAPQWTIYKVQSGDTRHSIVLRFHTDSSTLVWLNPGLSAMPRDGEVLRVARDASVYQVQAGDTLSRIGKEHGLLVGEILALNPTLHFNSDLTVGDRILLPDSRQAVVDALGGGSPRQALVVFAERYLGYPYHEVGGNPAEGFSCVAFTYWVYTALGVQIPGYLQGQLSAFPKVPRDQIKPGDIILFRNTVWRGLSHAALYIGDGKIIHDADFRNGVQITFLSDPYYASRYLTAVDPLAGLGLAEPTKTVADIPPHL